MRRLNCLVRRIFKFPIRVYQYCISPLFPPCCRYYPSCSRYALDAIEIHGVFKGILLAAWRILRCNPFSKGGYDPVPPAKRKNSALNATSEITNGKQ
ncbi:MAG: membrane protein insertion efficiency factor YidD [Mailhella sp.]|nr:membrane protein insertion efficiency factor YidD [Mailhella sp.]